MPESRTPTRTPAPVCAVSPAETQTATDTGDGDAVTTFEYDADGAPVWGKLFSGVGSNEGLAVAVASAEQVAFRKGAECHRRPALGVVEGDVTRLDDRTRRHSAGGHLVGWG